MRRITLSLLALVIAGGLAAGKPDTALAGANNSAVAINTKDGSSLFRFAFKVSRVAGDIVDNQNSAVAYSKCQSCQTTAIAIQIVLVTGTPSTVKPENVSIAVNEQCTLCETFASAYQFVVGTGGPVKFTKLGRQEIAAIKRDIRGLKREDISPFELQQRMSGIVGRLRTVLKTQLVPARGDDDDDDDGGERGDDDEDDEEQSEREDGKRPTGTATVEDEGTETVQAPTATTETQPATTTATTPTTTETAPTTTDSAPTQTTTTP